MKRFGLILLGVTVSGSMGSSLVSCSKQLSCGPGTVEQNGECVAGGTAIQNCGDGGVIIGGNCYPIICGTDTKFDPASGMCVGTGGGNTTGCSSSCSAPNASTVCITGTVKDFVTEAVLPDADRPRIKVRVFDPIAFATNPTGTQPLAVSLVESMGCYIADGVPRPSSGLIALSADDADMTTTDDFATMGVGAILQANRNVTGLTAYKLEKTQVATWDTQIGTIPGCSGGLIGCGAWIGHYIAHDGTTPVQNVRPTRPGDDPPMTNIFCFENDRGTINPARKTTSAVGMCFISPDAVETHAGQCGAGGCMCGTMPCAAVFTGSTGGTAPGVIFYQPFVSSM